ncbi:MAG: T9SS type A sorting domain-containing protein, partial [Bacteroidota bacterium]
DLTVFNNYGFAHYFENIGTNQMPNFTTLVQNPFGIATSVYYTGAQFADLDGDGDLDLMVGDGNGVFRYQEDTTSTSGGTNSLPIISMLANDSICNTDTLGPMAFMVNDPDGDPLTVTATSSDQAVIADASIMISGTAPNYSLMALPTGPGDAIITVTADDSMATVQDSFMVHVDDCSIGIDESFFADRFDLWPNPADRQVRFELGLHAPAHGLEVRLLDMQGKAVAYKSYTDSGTDFSGELDVQALAAGMYFMEVRTDIFRLRKKLIVE